MAGPMILGRRTGVLAHGDVFFAVALISIVGIMVVPLPTFLLDILLSFNIAFSLVLLLASIYAFQAVP
jgi:flagellar biosynthesis protein FlhA